MAPNERGNRLSITNNSTKNKLLTPWLLRRRPMPPRPPPPLRFPRCTHTRSRKRLITRAHIGIRLYATLYTALLWHTLRLRELMREKCLQSCEATIRSTTRSLMDGRMSDGVRKFARPTSRAKENYRGDGDTPVAPCCTWRTSCTLNNI